MKNNRLLRGPFVWVLVLVVALFMTFSLVNSASAPEELTFNEFVELAESGAFRVPDGEDLAESELVHPRAVHAVRGQRARQLHGHVLA